MKASEQINDIAERVMRFGAISVGLHEMINAAKEVVLLEDVAEAADWVWNEIRENDYYGYVIDDVKCVPALRKALANWRNNYE